LLWFSALICYCFILPTLWNLSPYSVGSYIEW
jgi:hypothetical protein